MGSSLSGGGTLRWSGERRVRLAYVVSHPIQYQAPMLRRIAQEPWVDLTVFFGSDFSVRGYKDAGFGVEVKWDVPLLEGYKYEFLPPLRDNGTASVLSPISRGLLGRLRGAKDAEAFDVLWIHGYSTANQVLAMLQAKWLGMPVLVRAESWLNDRPRSRAKLLAKRLCFALLSHLVDGVLAIGSRNKAYWEHYLRRECPVFFMPYAVDNAFFADRCRESAATREALRAELRLQPGRPIILFASKLQRRKQCDHLIAAYAELLARSGQVQRPYLLIVGDGDQRQVLQEQADATGLDSIRFCGFRNQTELPRFLDLCSVFVLPSRQEPWGLIVNEAMNAGRPIVVSDEVGCQVDLVTDGVEGCVFKAGDIHGLAHALERALACPEETRAMGARALERISDWSFEADVAGLREAVMHVTRRLSPLANRGAGQEGTL